MLILEQWIGAAILALVTALTAWAFWTMRHRIPFAKIMLKTVLSITKVNEF
jgi:hypothetical protein